MFKYGRNLIKACFWEYDFTIDDIKKMASGNNEKEKEFLFDKIINNSTDLLNDLEIFNKHDLKMLLEQFVIPEFNSAFLQRRKNIAEYYFFDKPLTIEELKWIA